MTEFFGSIWWLVVTLGLLITFHEFGHFWVARRLGVVLRDIARLAMDQNAAMNAHMNETLNIGGALLVKLFGRAREEVERFRQRAAGVRDIGIHRAVVGSGFFVIIGLVSAVGTALVYGLGVEHVADGTNVDDRGDWRPGTRALAELGVDLDWTLRRANLLVADDTLVAWFSARIPDDITDVRRFDRWWRDQWCGLALRAGHVYRS